MHEPVALTVCKPAGYSARGEMRARGNSENAVRGEDLNFVEHDGAPIALRNNLARGE